MRIYILALLSRKSLIRKKIEHSFENTIYHIKIGQINKLLFEFSVVNFSSV